MSFGGARGSYPFAIKVAAGKINAVSGELWTNGLNQDPQDYMVVPGQPWLDGYNVEKGIIRQFVAAPLGEGHTAEEQIIGNAAHGGIQLIVYPMKAERYAKIQRPQLMGTGIFSLGAVRAGCAGLGLAPGGRMKQEIYDDKYGLDAWDLRHTSRCFVTIANAAVWQAVTGEKPPGQPPTASDYSKAGLPWFDYYDSKREAVAGSKALASLRTYLESGRPAQSADSHGDQVLHVEKIIQLKHGRPREVREAPV